MRCEFIAQNELRIQRLGNTSIGNNERYVQYATWSAQQHEVSRGLWLAWLKCRFCTYTLILRETNSRQQNLHVL